MLDFEKSEGEYRCFQQPQGARIKPTKSQDLGRFCGVFPGTQSALGLYFLSCYPRAGSPKTASGLHLDPNLNK